MSSSPLEILTKDEQASLTPMMRQYLSIKEQYPDYLVFYRMGDFFELFFDDAVKAAPVLDIALTRRGKQDGNDIPMCGVPAHSSDPYLEKLIRAGLKVVICEQTESPAEAKKRGPKSVIRREVVRIVTPGTLTEETLLEGKKSNYLCSIYGFGHMVALSWVDISTGEFFTTHATRQNLASELSRISPKEILVPVKLWHMDDFSSSLQEWKNIISDYADNIFEFARAERKVKTFFNVTSLEVFGKFNKPEVSAAGALLEYVELTQVGKMPRIMGPKNFHQENYLSIDGSTRRNLELFSSLSGDYRGSLMSVIDKCQTSFGSRLLAYQLASPLIDPKAINARLDAVEFFYLNGSLRTQIRACLAGCQDMERAISRISLSRGGPRDLVMIRQTLEQAFAIFSALEFSGGELPSLIKSAVAQAADNGEIINLLTESIGEAVPFHARDGGFIREGFNAALDNIRGYHSDAEKIKTDLRDKYRLETGIATLKVGENNLIGIYLEVTGQHLGKVPDSFIHRQTMTGGARFTTPELREVENRIVNAKEQALSLELEIFGQLVAEVLKTAEEISLTAQSLAALDVASALAELAAANNYNRPEVTSGFEFNIESGRHPVVEAINKGRISIVSNDCDLAEDRRLWILTGPNMAGKSTFLRQNALIAIMAQMGSFVPAKAAVIGAVDKLFSRVGASDNLARGQSTFMVEMVETATILNQATERSLVILDEIGRGTATYDGLSIAWAVVEYLHSFNRSRGIFATHYHELTALCTELPHLASMNMKVEEWEEKIIFLYQVASGSADKSYGIHVAEYAGLPKDVIVRAKEILNNLEKGKAVTLKPLKHQTDLPLFKMQEKPSEAEDKIRQALKNADPDSLSPRAALDLLYTIKDIIK